MQIDLFDTKIKDPKLLKKLGVSYSGLLKNGQYVLGENLLNFEVSLSEYLNTKYAVGVNSGTDALQLSLIASGIKEGDIVITSAFTYFATIEAIKNAGGKPYLADIELETLQINLKTIDKNILKKAKFIIPVHLFGGLVDVKHLLHISKEYKLKIIEDVAQSFGTKFKNKFLGNFGECGAFSFYPTKTLGSIGDAGAVTTNKKSIYENLIKLRNHGHIDRDNFKFSGFNSRLDEIQAIYLNERLSNIDNEIKKRQDIGKFYLNKLNDLNKIKFFNNNLKTYNYFPVLVGSRSERDKLRMYLLKNNIQTSIYYKVPLSDLKFNWILKGGGYENVNYVKKRILCLPIYPALNNSKLSYVVRNIKNFYET